VPRHPRLQKRGSRYFLRVRVPTDLRSAIGKREIRKALGTSDPREALRRVRRASVEADAIFETCRAKAGPAASDRVPASEADLERLVLQAFQASERQNLTTFLETPEEDYGEILSGLRDDESVYRGGLSPVVLPCLQKKADELLAANGLTLDPSSNTYTRFLWLLIRADLENIQRARERYSGNPTEPVFDRMFATSGAETSAPLSSSGGLTLRELIERYEKDPARRGLTEKTRHAYGTMFRALRELLGENKRARDITREDCRRVQEILCSLPPERQQTFAGSHTGGGSSGSQGARVAPAAPQNRDELPEQPLRAVQLGCRRGACREEPRPCPESRGTAGIGQIKAPVLHRPVDPNIQRSPLHLSRGRQREMHRPVLGTSVVVVDRDEAQRMRATPKRRCRGVGWRGRDTDPRG